MPFVNTDHIEAGFGGRVGAFRSLLSVCTTFGSNVVERFHEYADARLAEELTIVEQRRRLLADRENRPSIVPRQVLAHRAGQLD